jgi:trypsin
MSLLAALAMPALTFAAALPQDFSTQIVGGTAAASGEFPFIVSVQTSSGSHFCGGTLLDADTVITAGHCAEGQTASRIRIRVGSTVSIAQEQIEKN